MQRVRLGFAVYLGVGVIAACSGVNPVDLGATNGPDSGSVDTSSSSGAASSGSGSSTGGSGGNGGSGGVAGSSGGIGVSGSSGGSSGSSSGSKGGSSSGGSSGSSSGSGSTGGSSGASDSGVPVACGSASCTSSKRFCCETPVSVGAVLYTCLATAASCMGEIALTQCDSRKNCGGGQVCCRSVVASLTSQLCQLSCTAGEKQLCSSASDCMAGQRCRIPATVDGGVPTTGTCVTSADSGTDTGPGNAADTGAESGGHTGSDGGADTGLVGAAETGADGTVDTGTDGAMSTGPDAPPDDGARDAGLDGDHE